MKTAQIEITTELLKQVLCIPDGVEVSLVRRNMEHYTRDTFSIVLYGDGLPDKCANQPEPPMLTPHYWKDNEQDIVSSVTWKVL
jgi:hypothetical protein